MSPTTAPVTSPRPEGDPVSAPTRPPTSFGWLLDSTVRGVAGVRLGILVSSDGLLMAVSSGLDRTTGDQLAAVVSGISGLARGAARMIGGQSVNQAVIDYDAGFLVLMTVSDGSILAFAADVTADVGSVGYEMALLAEGAESALTPQLVAEMRRSLPTDGATRATG
ncbi:roadblock/LC7 domain-containing protein [Cellulomonas sp. IC4_254]|nr:roadblock/LC7 domain-containing protein [Cellulomonas sp. IC4_254]